MSLPTPFTAMPSHWCLPVAALTQYTRPTTQGTLTPLVSPPETKPIWKIGFNVGRWKLLIADTEACQIMNKPTLYPLPGARPWWLGVANIRGHFIPCFDLAQYLTETLPTPQKLLLIGKAPDAFGLLINGFPSREGFWESESLSQPLNLPPKLLKHTFAQYRRSQDNTQELWAEIDHTALALEMADANIATV
jgi:chemotaxis signal transduction protein